MNHETKTAENEMSNTIPETHITLEEFLTRLGIAKSTFQYNEKRGVVHKNSTMVVSEAGEFGSWKISHGLYVNWLEVATALLAVMQTPKRLATIKHLKKFGFGKDLKAIDGNPVIRLGNHDCKAYKSAKKLHGDDISPEELGLGFWSHDIGGVPKILRRVKRNKAQGNSLVAGSRNQDLPTKTLLVSNPVPDSLPEEDILPFEETALGDREDSEQTTGSSATTSKRVETSPSLASSDKGEYVDTFDTILQDIDYDDPDDVNNALSRIEVRKKFNSARVEEIKAAKLSNSVLELDEISKLLNGTMVAVRTTIDQSAPKVTEEILGLILTQIAVAEPSLQAKIAKMIDKKDILDRVREVFNRSLHELANLLDAFSRTSTEIIDDVEQDS